MSEEAGSLHQLQQEASGAGGVLALAPWAWAPALVAAVGLAIYAVFMRRLDYQRTLEDVGYVAFDGMSKRESANRVRRARKEGRVPPVYPNGWYLVMESDQLRVGQAKSVQMIGKTLAVFRSESGEAHILDAYCPHFGANIGAGGRVRGDCLECPFHGWQFRGSDGKCTHIPVLADNAKTFLQRLDLRLNFVIGGQHSFPLPCTGNFYWPPSTLFHCLVHG